MRELKELKRLSALDLSGTQLTDAGAKEVKVLKQLEVLILNVTKVTNACVEELQNALLPKCQITR